MANWGVVEYTTAYLCVALALLVPLAYMAYAYDRAQEYKYRAQQARKAGK